MELNLRNDRIRFLDEQGCRGWPMFSAGSCSLQDAELTNRVCESGKKLRWPKFAVTIRWGCCLTPNQRRNK